MGSSKDLRGEDGVRDDDVRYARDWCALDCLTFALIRRRSV